VRLLGAYVGPPGYRTRSDQEWEGRLRKAVAIVSGGIDSSTLLYDLLNQGFETHALTFAYGQKHSKEIEAAKQIASKLHVDHKVIDISAVREILNSSALIGSGVSIPEVPETAEYYDALKSTIVPNRNSIFLSLAIAYAVNIGADHVYYGAHSSDRGVYPDCRREFVDAFAHAERLATDNFELKVEAPFVNANKSDIVRLGNKLGVPFGITWSCYRGEKIHCGTCSSCRERRRAFAEAQVKDPTEYEQ
jgi:7-cyano-7-deazaguanine synthase